MNKVNKFCKSLYERNINNLADSFQDLPEHGKYIAVMQALSCILYPSNKTLVQRALSYSLFRICFEFNSTDKVWDPILKSKTRARKLYEAQHDIYEKFMNGQLSTTKKTSSRKVSKTSSKKVSKTSSRKVSKTSSRKKYNKYFQTKETPDDHDPLVLYYTSLYSENLNSECSIEWLTKYGIFDGTKREKLVMKYEKLKQKKKLDKKQSKNFKK